MKVPYEGKELKNNFSFQISKRGNIGEPSVLYAPWGVKYDSFLVIYSSGFLLSGYKDSKLWASGQFESRRLYHYRPGPIGSNSAHPSVNLYVIESSEPAFSQSWQTYRFAVQNGAPFYDGDNDGIYNPVDKNGNGQWDEDEDAPEMIGDISTWSVINDSYFTTPAFNIPQKVEVQISTFSFNLRSLYEDQIFIRYRIINRGETNEALDSVIFSFYVDPDIENYDNDYLGSDTTLNLGYTYSGFDKGVNIPPAIGVTLLQGSPVYIPNKTFLDKNNDGIFTPNIDTPIDTAIYKYGSNIPSKILPGAKNQTITSFFKKLTYDQSSPKSANEYRFWQNSIHYDGQMLDPCNDPFGIVLGNVNCSDVNKKFLYSGDPKNRIGWINRLPEYDATFLLSTGPFKLEKDVPVDIWGVYVGGRGVDSLHSIVKLKENSLKAINFYKNLPVIFEKPELPKEYVLYQNYPNPFNSGTTIKWKMPQSGRAVIKIYDILGREIEKIVDNFFEGGEHLVRFNPENSLASGVYFYQIKVDDYIQTKKMILLK